MLRKVLLISVVLFLPACATLEPRTQEVRSIASSQIADTPDYWTAAAARVGAVENGWISAFKDPQLTQLVTEAQANNRNLRTGALNVERSWLLAQQAGAALSPQASGRVGGISAGGFGGRGSSERVSVGLQASWEVDVWGRIRSGQQAAISSAQAAEADYRFAQLSIAAAVARAYFGAINAEQQTQISAEIVTAITEIQRITQVRRDNGLASGQDVALAQANLASARDTYTRAAAGKQDALRALDILLGRYPSAGLLVGATLPRKPADPPAGLPSELLERRPDLIAAERRIAAAIDTVDQSKSARLPSISLTGGVSGASTDLLSLLSPSNLAWQTASSLLLPIMDGGVRRTQIEVSTVSQRAAVEAYVQAALNALNDVETALANGQTLARRRVFLLDAERSSDEALRLARIQYQEGEIDLLSVLQLEQSAFRARSDVINLERLALDQYIDLNLALGGGWQ